MPSSPSWREGHLKLVLQNVGYADLGDATGIRPSSTAGSVYVALHTGAPTTDQSTNEATYTGYTRIAVPRDALSWDVTGNLAVNVAEITFPEASGGSETLTHCSVGLEASGATNYLYYGELDTPRAVSSGIEPRFKAGELKITSL